MQLVRVYYQPPEGYPPLMFPSSGAERMFQPPDQYWKKEKREYIQGIIMHEKLGVPRIDPKTRDTMTKKGIRKELVLDKEKNAAMRDGDIPPPKNYLDITDGDNRMLYEMKGRGDKIKFRNKDDEECEVSVAELIGYLKHETDIEREMKGDLTRKQAEHDKALAEMDATFARKEREFKRKEEMLAARIKAIEEKQAGLEGAGDAGPPAIQAKATPKAK